MSYPFDIYLPPEQAYQRNVLFAIEVLDAVTLGRVTQGLKVTVAGLKGKPISNASGLFVWLQEDPNAPQTISIDPGTLPYEEAIDVPAVPVQRLQVIELAPRSSYPFAPGTTGLLGYMVEHRTTPPAAPQSVTDAEVRLLWLDDDGVTWHDAPTRSHTYPDGDFAAVIRFAPNEVPRLDANGALTVRLRAARAGGAELGTTPFALPQGRVADAQTFAWGELQP
jgi:hypothetical protein